MSKVAHSQPGRDEPAQMLIRFAARYGTTSAKVRISSMIAGQSWRGQIMAYAGKHEQPGTRYCCCGCAATAWLDQRVSLAV
jgi:hypothetical protein